MKAMVKFLWLLWIGLAVLTLWEWATAGVRITVNDRVYTFKMEKMK